MMCYFFSGFFIGLIISILLFIIYIIKRRPVRQQNNTLEEKIKELQIEIKKSANPNIPNDIDGQADILKKLGGSRIK